MGFGFKVLVEAPAACFTRPEMKAERVSYDVITPSAARGVLEAVYWKPAICWKIDGIDVLNEIEFDTFRRNEVKSKVRFTSMRNAWKGGEVDVGLDVNDIGNRTQRATVYLRDVAYVISAHFELTGKASEQDTVEKHYNIALRRLRKGQCFNQPYLGCREFAASKILLLEDDFEKPVSFYENKEIDLGWMLYDLDFENGMVPMFYRAKMVDGFIDVAAARGGMLR
jgi:CRISPR-associated protein Cas5d